MKVGNEKERVAKLLRDRHKELLSISIRICQGKREDANDLLGILHEKAIKAATRYDPSRSFVGWCTRILTNSRIDLGRKNSIATVQLNFEDQTSEFGCEDPVDSDQVVREHLRSLCEHGVITPELEVMLCLDIIEKHTIKEIAGILGETRSSVAGRVYRAKKAIRKYCAGRGQEYFY